MKAWIYIVTAAFLQMLWGICLKYLDFALIFDQVKLGNYSNPALISQMIPFASYLILGFLIVIVVSKAYKLLPMSIVYAAWMGLTLLFQVLVDTFFYHENLAILQYLCIGLILIGVIGMKQSNHKAIIEEGDHIIDELIHEVVDKPTI